MPGTVTDGSSKKRPRRRRTLVDLSDLKPGKTVAITTKTGSTYWLTVVRNSSVEGKKFYGLSVMTNWATPKRSNRPPSNTYADRYIRAGTTYVIGKDTILEVVDVEVL